MSAVKRGRRGKGAGDAEDDISKEEYAVAKYLRFNVPTKTTTLCGMRVEYFVGSKTIDALLSSKWGEGARKGASKLFPARDDCVSYCQRLLNRKKLFHRARKIVQAKKCEKDESEDVEERVRRRKKKDGSAEAKEAEAEEGTSRKRKKKKVLEEDSVAEDGAGTPQKERKKKRIKLDMHEDQTFIDGSEAYVWIYDPIRPQKFLIGLILVIGAIAVCLFPLWPEWMRVGAYYLSLTAATLLGFILGLSIFRYVLYAGVWIVTLGKVHFFLLPNLTEDVGFLDSFLPLYELEIAQRNEENRSKRKKRRKAKDSDAEMEGDSDGGGRRPEETQNDEDADDNAGDEEDDNPGEDDNPEDEDDNPGDEENEQLIGDDAENEPSNATPSRSDHSASASDADADYEVIHHEDFEK